METKTYQYLKPFRPYEWQVNPWRDKSPVLLLTGSAGGGKSRLAAEKLHAFCLKYPFSTALILRKSRAVIGNSTLLFLQSEVIGNDPRVKKLETKFRFEYENGSILAWGGMKDAEQRERIRSFGLKGGIDICWMEEATQFDESDFNEVMARMRGRAADWRQIILTTNPDAPMHWIRRRLILSDDPSISVRYSGARDNPINPESYYDMLEQLTGVEYQRLVLGKWAAGSGRVIDTWVDHFNRATGEDNGGNVTYDAEYVPDGGTVMWSIDDGYSGKYDPKTKMFSHHSHPRVFLLCQIKQTGVISVFAEHYAVETLADEHIERVIDMSTKHGWPIPRWVIRDRAAASLGGALEAVQMLPRYSQMTVDESVKELRQWVGKDKNEVRRFIVHPRCVTLRQQMASYSMSEEGRIIKQYDDGPDAARYIVWDRAYGVSPEVDIAVWDAPPG